MIIRSESFLPRRDFAIHEAGHYCIGIAFGFPMDCPQVFRDGSGGIAPFDRTVLKHDPDIDLSGLPGDEMKQAALRIAAMFLAGCAAEAIAADVDCSCIVGGRTSDLRLAVQCIRDCGLSDLSLQDAWRLSVKMLRHAWPLVESIAQDIPVTDGSHRPPKFH